MRELDPARTVLLIVDPQVAFASPGGSLARHFGPDDIAPIPAVLRRVRHFADRLPAPAMTVVVRSEYPPGLVVPDDPGSALARLCVPGEGDDCAWAPGFEPLPSWRIVTKHDQDAWSSLEVRALLRRLAHRRDQIVVAGCLLTTCVRATVLSLRARLPEVEVVVPRDLVAARRSAAEPSDEGPSRVDRVYRELRDVGATIVTSCVELSWR